ncbi:uncharacterized protein K02A2.6-like isoform X1 [Aedes albopictus]|uniref:RNA-directed DNA polymerase n=1 Tax=Aedes albopictus TaxID=7160 RepID=A0ABM1ZGQ3_AEDAL
MSLTTTTEPYVPGSIPFSQYLEQLEFLFEHNNYSEDKYKISFLAVCGTEVFNQVKLLFPGQNVRDLTYRQITDELKKRYDKKDSDVIHTYRFWTRRQGQHEKSEDFVLSIKQLAELCGFGAFKDRAIRDALVIGTYDRQLQKRLFDEEDLTAAKAEKLIVNQELSSDRTRFVNRDDEQRGSIVARLGRRMERGPTQQAYSNRKRSFDRNRPYYYRSRSNGRRDDDRNTEKPFTCSFCHKAGHTKKFCFRLKRKSPRKSKQAVKFIDSPKPSTSHTSGLFKRLKAEMSDDSDDEDSPCMMIAARSKVNEPCYTEAIVQGRRMTLEVDCGSAESVISEALYTRYFSKFPIEQSRKRLYVIDGNRLSILGKVKVSVQLNGLVEDLYLIVLQCDKDFVPLMGRSWLDVFFSGWRNAFAGPVVTNQFVNALTVDGAREDAVADVKRKFPTLFDKNLLNPIVGFKGDLILKDDTPVFKKAYEVPLRLRDKVVEHLDNLEKDGVITPIEASEWASPVVVVVKKDQGIRLVIDCKVSINKLIIPNKYPLPLPQELFATLSGSKVFCSLDLAGAYSQLLLSKRSKKFMVINTIKGLYVYNRLPQGASSSAAIFQKVMDQVLKGLENVSCYLDDVLIAGKDFEDCKNKLYLVLERLAKFNIKVNLKKCKFFVSSLPYLGHVLTEKGLLPCPEKVQTIREAKAPRNVTELKAFLGLITYYAKFIPNLSSRIRILYGLLKKNAKFVWTPDCDFVFNQCKHFLLSPNVLEFFDPEKPVVVVTDACNYGLGGVIAHVVNGEERPVAFTSFSLNDAQKKYPILHLEALAVVSTVKKFHKYLYGKKFIIYTDHKPLIGIFGKEGRNSLSVTRLQRYVMDLSIYDYEIIYRPSTRMGNADFCSRFPVSQEVPKEIDREYVKSLNFTGEFPLDYRLIAAETKKDEFLLRIREYIENGWPDRLEKRFLDVYSHYQDLEDVDGCIIFQDRVVIPNSMKNSVLKLLHRNHAGMHKIKQLARRTVYWFGMNGDIEEYVRTCRICQETTAVSKRPSYSPWIPTNRPFSRIHADFFFFEKKVFLVVVDSYTKWLEIEQMKYGTDSKKVIKIFMSIIARYGLPDVLVTDGGPPFNSSHFVNFFKEQGVIVMKSPAYHPESNGQAERMVRLIKDVLKKFLLDPEIRKLDMDEQLSYFLMNYRNICLGTDSKFPSERLLSYKPKTTLDLINPKKSFKYNLTESEDKQHNSPDNACSTNANSDKDTTERNFTNLQKGQTIFYKNPNKTDIRSWLPVKFIIQVSPNVFQISLGGRIISAHKRQLKIPTDSRRQSARRFVFSGESPSTAVQPCSSKNASSNNNKRKRDDDGESEDSDSDFYGFAADSFLFGEENVSARDFWANQDAVMSDPRSDRDEVTGSAPALEMETHVGLSDLPVKRRSKRSTKKRRKDDYMYY